jgi:eukaryotic-like serine/threonine-protein kinase
LWVRSFHSETAQLLADTAGGSFPFWSPDSKFIAFFAEGYLKRVPASGGPVTNIIPIESARGGTWGPDNTILYTPRFRDGLYLVNAAGGSPRRLTAPETTGHTSHRWPSFLPGGKRFLYYAGHHENLNSSRNGVYMGSIDGRVNQLVLPSRTQAQYVSGYLLYYAGTALLAQRFQPTTSALERDPVTLAAGVQMDPMIWRATFSASEAGPLVYQSGTAGGGSDLLWYDRSGKIVGRIGGHDHYGDFFLSADHRRVVVALGDPEPDLWMLDMASGRPTRLTFGEGAHASPVWSPDGQRIAFAWRRKTAGQSSRTGVSLYVRGVAGTEAPETIIEAPAGSSALPLAWSPDGRYIAYFDQSGSRARLSVVPLFGDRKPMVAAEESAGQASLSPDGRWLAYDTIIGGKMEVFVTLFPRGQGRWQVSQDGGLAPFWSDAGNELFFLGSNNMLHAAAVESKGQEFRIRDDRVLFRVFAAGITQPFRVTQRGQRILANTLPMDPTVPFTVVVNWTSLLSGR